MKPFNNLKKKTSSDTYWRVQIVCKKFQAHSSSEPQLEYNQDQTPLMNQISSGPLILGVNIFSFRLVLAAKSGKEIPKSSRLEFLGKFLANNFALSDAEDNTSGLLNRGGIADLSLLRTLLAICQKSWVPSFWEKMDSFVLLTYATLAASRTLLHPTIACLNFTLDTEDLFC